MSKANLILGAVVGFARGGVGAAVARTIIAFKLALEDNDLINLEDGDDLLLEASE